MFTRCDCCGVIDGTVDGGLCDECFSHLPDGRWVFSDDLVDIVSNGTVIVPSPDWLER